MLEMGRRIEEAAVGNRHKIAEMDSGLDCAEEPVGGLGCNSLLKPSCLFLPS